MRVSFYSCFRSKVTKITTLANQFTRAQSNNSVKSEEKFLYQICMVKLLARASMLFLSKKWENNQSESVGTVVSIGLVLHFCFGHLQSSFQWILSDEIVTQADHPRYARPFLLLLGSLNNDGDEGGKNIHSFNVS